MNKYHVPSSIHKREQYFVLLCRTISKVGLVISLLWLAFFFFTGKWVLMTSLLVLGVAVLPCWCLVKRGRISAGLMLSQFICLTYIIYFSLVFDVPDDGIERTTHLFLPVIVLIGFINYQRKKEVLQIVLILLCLGAFVALCSARLRFHFASPMAADFRAISSWINASVSTLMLCTGIVAMQADFTRRIGWARDIQMAIHRNELVLYFQPLICGKGNVIGAEALLRWHHPTRGIIFPNNFIPAAQSAGLMPLVGDWVIRAGLKQLSEWQADPVTSKLSLSINITVDHLMMPGFDTDLIAQARRARVPFSKLKLEITESVFASDTLATVERMNTLSTAGFCFSLDDFGTGFSALNYLQRLPLQQIKIDRSFVTESTQSQKGAIIARNIVRMGLELNLQLLAEGIETPEQWRVMQSLGCTVFQGYLFSRPLVSNDFYLYLSQRAQQPLTIE